MFSKIDNELDYVAVIEIKNIVLFCRKLKEARSRKANLCCKLTLN